MFLYIYITVKAHCLTTHLNSKNHLVSSSPPLAVDVTEVITFIPSGVLEETK